MRLKVTSLLRILRASLRPDTWKTLGSCDVIILRHDADCPYTYKSKAYGVLIDSLKDLFENRELRVSTVARPYSTIAPNQAYGSPVLCNRAALSIRLRKELLACLKGRMWAKEWADKQESNLWRGILDKTTPRVVVAIQPSPSLCRACRFRAIPVYDLQHGVIDEQHIWYGEKYRKETPLEDLPDGFLCWDEPSAEVLRNWVARKGITVQIIGNLWFARFLKRDQRDLLVNEALKKGRIFADSKKVVLVSLQHGLEYYYKNKSFNGIMVDALEKVILETADTYNWMIRLHPGQMRWPEKKRVCSYLTHTFGDNPSIDWRITSEIPLPLVLQQTDLHITDSSSVVIEAGWMGIPTGVLNTNLYPGSSLGKLYERERNLGLANILKQDPVDIKTWITLALSNGKRDMDLCCSAKGLRNFLDEICSKGKASVESEVLT